MPFTPDSSASSFKPDVQKKGGILSRIGEVIGTGFKQRVANINQSSRDVAAGKQTKAQDALNFVGQAAGFIGNDLIGGVAGEAIKSLPQDYRTMVAKKFSETPGGKIALRAVTDTAKAYGAFSDTHPNAARDIGNIANIASIVPIEGAANVALKSTGEAADAAKTATGTLIKDTAAKGSGILSKVANSSALSEAGQTAKEVAGFGVTQATGLSPNTVKQVINNPDLFTREVMDTFDRQSLAEEVRSALTDKFDELSDLGKEYNPIRQSGQVVTMEDGALGKTLNKFGVQLDDSGKIVHTKSSMVMSKADESALQDFIDLYGDSNQFTADEFLNARKRLSNMAKYDAAKTDASKTMARELRSTFDKYGKAQIPGLKELDAEFAPLRNEFDALKADYLNSDLSLKDTAITKIANLTNKGREKILSRLEGVIPDIRQKVNILKAVEDIEIAKGQKVGSYFRSVVGGASLATGFVPGIAVAVLSSPTVVIKLLRAYSKARGIAVPVIERLIGKMTTGEALDIAEKNIVKDVLNPKNKAAIGEELASSVPVAAAQPAKQEFASALDAMQSPEMQAKYAKIAEMKKKKSGLVTARSRNLYHTTQIENLESISRDGLVVGSKPRFSGVSSEKNISFSANEAAASYYGGDGDIMIRTKTSYKPKRLAPDLLAGGEGVYVSPDNVPADMLEAKIGGKWVALDKAREAYGKMVANSPQSVAKLDSILKSAPAANKELETMANQVASTVPGAQVILGPVKTRARIMEKAISDYNGDIAKVRDVIRSTVVVNTPEELSAVASTLGEQSIPGRFKITASETDPLGYSGVLSNVETPSGVVGEIQANTKAMIFAKQDEGLARGLLGDAAYDELAAKTGLRGGLGHDLYEKWRVLDPGSAEAKALAAKSRDYYAKIKAAAGY